MKQTFIYMHMHIAKDDTIKQKTKSMKNLILRLERLIRLVVNPGGASKADELSTFFGNSDSMIAMVDYNSKHKTIEDVILNKFKKKL